MHAPVRVARSTMASGASSVASERPSARISRPSASVLSTSTVLPLRIVSTSPTRVASPPVMLSVIGRKPEHPDLGAERGDGRKAPSTGGGPAHVALHADHPVGRLQRQPAGVEGDPLADQGDGALRLRRRTRGGGTGAPGPTRG